MATTDMRTQMIQHHGYIRRQNVRIKGVKDLGPEEKNTYHKKF